MVRVISETLTLGSLGLPLTNHVQQVIADMAVQAEKISSYVQLHSSRARVG